VPAASPLLGLLGVVLTATVATPTAPPAAPLPTAVVSPHWAGYVATGLPDAPDVFTSVTASWVQPRASCRRGGRPSAAVIWVGIGGYAGGSQELEQIGSTAGCDRRGHLLNSVWFALLPYPAHTIAQTVRPGDALTGTVTILPTGTRLRLVNRTRAWDFVRTIDIRPADTSSAEWIVEPPMSCARSACSQMRLANFGALTFTDVGAVAHARSGTLRAPEWAVTAVELTAVASSRGPASAIPGGADAEGSSFTVTWHPSPHRHA
jgi:hypothetical protein